MNPVTCHSARPHLLEQAGAVDDVVAAHLQGCVACDAFARQLRADVALLRDALTASAPADLAPPLRGSRPLPSLAVAEGRNLPAGWFALPAAAAAILLAVGVWHGATKPEAPRIANVQIEPMSGPEWAGVMRIAADDRGSGPVGPLVDRALDDFAAGDPGR